MKLKYFIVRLLRKAGILKEPAFFTVKEIKRLIKLGVSTY